MAQGLGFIEFSTGDVLSAAAANGYLASQTVMVFADAAARTAAITTPYEGMMSYLKDTNATEYYSGSAWVAVGGSSPLTTKGDLYGYSTTNARVPVGTNGQVLTADSTAATGVSWATAASGSMTQLATGTFSNNALSITSISGSYKSLVLRMNNIYANNQDIDFRFNSDTGNNYGWTQMAMNGTSVNRTNTTTSFQFTQPYIQNGQGPNFVELTIPDYSNTNSWKSATAQWSGNAAGTRDGAWSLCTYSSTSAITSIQTRTAVTSGSYTLFGVN